jgi:hypothetical protein
MICQQEGSNKKKENDGPILVGPSQVGAKFSQKLSNDSRKEIHNTSRRQKVTRGISYGTVTREIREQKSCARSSSFIMLEEQMFAA